MRLISGHVEHEGKKNHIDILHFETNILLIVHVRTGLHSCPTSSLHRV